MQNFSAIRPAIRRRFQKMPPSPRKKSFFSHPALLLTSPGRRPTYLEPCNVGLARIQVFFGCGSLNYYHVIDITQWQDDEKALFFIETRNLTIRTIPGNVLRSLGKFRTCVSFRCLAPHFEALNAKIVTFQFMSSFLMT